MPHRASGGPNRAFRATSRAPAVVRSTSPASISFGVGVEFAPIQHAHEVAARTAITFRRLISASARTSFVE